MSETLERLDARTRRGTYLVTTLSGTHYYVEVRKSAAGGMRVISDGKVVKMVRQGVVGGCGCSEKEPIIRIDQSMHLTEHGEHIVMTMPILTIEKVEDDIIDTLVCTECWRGYKVAGKPCHLCHH